jgi:hypothetical protein
VNAAELILLTDLKLKPNKKESINRIPDSKHISRVSGIGGSMQEAILCLVSTEEEAQRIIDALRAKGFSNADISVLLPAKNFTRDVGYEKHSKAPEGTAAGASTGALLGGALGWLTGIGSLAIPGVGPFIAAGPIMAMLGGAALGGTVGGITGGLIGLGIPEIEAKQYEGKLRDGNILISFHAQNNSQAKQAEEVFKALGGHDIMRTLESKVAS